MTARTTPVEHAFAAAILAMLTDGPADREEIDLAVTGAIASLVARGSIELAPDDAGRWQLAR